jgi:LytS/YehU family sensor histidine kinase
MGQGFLDITVNETYSSAIVITLTNSGNYQPSEHNGIGLVHVYKRLEELYNGSAKLDIHQEENQVIVQLKLPLA